jgi:hypothetical protein
MQLYEKRPDSRTKTDRYLRAFLALALLVAGAALLAAELAEGPDEGEDNETDWIDPAPIGIRTDATPISLSAMLPPISQPAWFVTSLGSGDGRVCVLYLEGHTVRSLTSLDGGTTFGPAVDVAGMPGQAEVMFYRATIGPDDRIHAALLVADPAGGLGLRYVRSDDLGMTWTSPSTLVTSGIPSFALYSHGLAISANGAGLVAITYTSDETGGTYVAYSINGGNSWAEVARRVDLAQGIPFTFYGDGAVLADSLGNIHVAYSQNRGTGRRLYVRRRSTAATWSEEGPTGTSLPLEGSQNATLAESDDAATLLAYWLLDGESIAVLRSEQANNTYQVSLEAPDVSADDTWRNPRLTTDPATQTVLLSYESDESVRSRRSADSGRTFSAEAVVAELWDMPHSVARSSGGTWAFSWQGWERTARIYFRSSDDDGVTFGPVQQVDSAGKERAYRGDPQLVATGDDFFVAYLDERGSVPPTPDFSTHIYANRTVGSPISFGSDYRIDTDDRTGPPISTWDYTPTVATDGADHVYAAFTALSPGPGTFRTLFVAVSSDGGKTFAAPVPVGESGWFNHNVPVITATADGHVYVVTHIDALEDGIYGRQLRFNRSSDFGQTWQPRGERLGFIPGGGAYGTTGEVIPGTSLAALPGGKVWVAWNDYYDVFLARSIDGGVTLTTEDVDQNDEPFDVGVTLCAQGEQVILTWVGGEYGENMQHLWSAVSDDGGASFGPRVALTTIPDTAWWPRMACDGTDKAVVVWPDERDLAHRLLWYSRYDGTSWSPDSQIPGPTDGHHDLLSRLVFTDRNLGEPSNVALIYEKCQGENVGFYDCRVSRRGASYSVYFNRSTDGGITFAPAVRLDLAAPEPDNDSYDPRVATDGYDNVWVSWQDKSANRSVRSVVVRRSTDGGSTFGPVLRLDARTEGAFTNVYGRTTETAALPGIGLFAWVGDNDGTFYEVLYLADDRTDDDSDGVNGSLDCDDTNPDVYPGAPQLCDGVNNDCVDPLWPEVPAVEADGDSDGHRICHGDCDDADPDTYPDAPEINDGLDNQCPGDAGYGVTDETSGNSGFHNPADRNEYSWTPQQGATQYEIARSGVPDFSMDCLTFTTSETFWVDTEQPLQGEVFHYLNRPVAPNVGSWGQTSALEERVVPCP